MVNTQRTELISGQQWNRHARRVERATLKARGKSLTATSISMAARHHIIEDRGDDNLIVTLGWRETMQASVDKTAEVLKLAVKREPGYPVGTTAPCYLDCPCGMKLDLPSTMVMGVRCPDCGAAYDAGGWRL